MNQPVTDMPTGRLVKLVWKSVGQQLQHSALEVRYEGPGGEQYSHQLSNGAWTLDNPALQFLAAMGYKPSDIEGTRYDAYSDRKGLLLAPHDPNDPDAGFGVAEAELEAGRDTLEKADWFDGMFEEEEQVEVQQAPPTDGSPDGPKA